ncbi:MAG TPA: hypothetical protein VK978_04095 [Candidatus Saccharimonadales bacterium]|nr:hypothetical protein [Candidatus Saccharimonadales bacterium]
MASKAGKQDAKRVKHWDAKLSHKIIHTVATIVVTLALVGGGAYAYRLFQQDIQTTYQSNPGKARVSTVEALNPARARFNEAAFTMDLPGDWKRLQADLSGPYKKYSYQAGLKNADNRYLHIYVDGIPLNMAVNKSVAVRGEGAKLSHGMVSENCIEFTAKPSSGALSVPAKWEGVDFLCDTDSVSRNVVGTSSPGMINKVELTNIGFTKRSFFFVYEDNNYTPDYDIFYKMLDSFTVK